MISDDEKIIVIGYLSGTVRTWNSRTGEAIGKSIEGHSDWIVNLAMSTDSNLIVSVGNDRMQQWYARSGEHVGEDIELPNSLIKTVVSNDGETIAGGSKSGDYVQKWETKTGKPIGETMKWSEREQM